MGFLFLLLILQVNSTPVLKQGVVKTTSISPPTLDRMHALELKSTSISVAEETTKMFTMKPEVQSATFRKAIMSPYPPVVDPQKSIMEKEIIPPKEKNETSEVKTERQTTPFTRSTTPVLPLSVDPETYTMETEETVSITIPEEYNEISTIEMERQTTPSWKESTSVYKPTLDAELQAGITQKEKYASITLSEKVTEMSTIQAEQETTISENGSMSVEYMTEAERIESTTISEETSEISTVERDVETEPSSKEAASWYPPVSDASTQVYVTEIGEPSFIVPQKLNNRFASEIKVQTTPSWRVTESVYSADIDPQAYITEEGESSSITAPEKITEMSTIQAEVQTKPFESESMSVAYVDPQAYVTEAEVNVSISIPQENNETSTTEMEVQTVPSWKEIKLESSSDAHPNGNLMEKERITLNTEAAPIFEMETQPNLVDEETTTVTLPENFTQASTTSSCQHVLKRPGRSLTSERMPGKISKKKCEEYLQYVPYHGSRRVKRFGKCPRFRSCILGGSIVRSVTGVKPRLYEGYSEFPHMALLVYKDEGKVDDRDQTICGGSLISKNFILTAAHCIITREGPPVYVKLGILNRYKHNHVQQIRVNESIPYPYYNSSLVYNDVGLLRLEKNVEFNNLVRPACLIPNGFKMDNHRLVATGWGATETSISSQHLMKVHLDQHDMEKCNLTFSDQISDHKGKLKCGVLKEQMVCVGGEWKNTCPGDSGGPLQVCLRTVAHSTSCPLYHIFGITAHGYSCDIDAPSIYMRISYYLQWIEDTVWPSEPLD